MLELGVGFAFVGENVYLEVGDDDFYLDCLFYHLQLRCYVVIELLCARAHNKSPFNRHHSLQGKKPNRGRVCFARRAETNWRRNL